MFMRIFKHLKSSLRAAPASAESTPLPAECAKTIEDHSSRPTFNRILLESDPSEVLSKTEAFLDSVESTQCVRIPDQDGMTPLMAVLSRPFPLKVDSDRSKIVSLLLGHGAEPNQLDRQLRTALMIAAATRDERSAVILLKSHADINMQDYYQRTPLWIACGQGWWDGARLFLSQGADPSCQNINGVTALMLVVEQRHEEICRLLLEAGADIAVQSFRRASALSTAAKYGWLVGVDLLLSRGAKVNMHYEYGQTPLLLAINADSLELVQYLVKQGADINVACEPDLDRDFRNGMFFDNVDWMKDWPFDSERTSRGIGCRSDPTSNLQGANYLGRGATPLISACSSHNIEIVRYLLAHGADVNAKTVQGRGALHLAVADVVCPEIVELLMEAGVTLGGLYPDETILHHLVKVNDLRWDDESFEAVLDMLLNAGVDPRSKNASGNSAADILRKCCEVEQFSPGEYPAYKKLREYEI